MGKRAWIAAAGLFFAAASGPAATVAEVTVLEVGASDIAYDPVRGDLVVAASASSALHAASLLWIDPGTGAIEEEIPLGEDPGTLAVSDGADYLFVSLRSVNEVWRYDLGTRTKDLVIDLGLDPDPFFDPLRGFDVAPVPGSPESIAVALTQGWNGTFRGVVVFDGAVPRANRTPPSAATQVLEFGEDPEVLYGLFNGTAATNFYSLAIDAAGVTVTTAVNAGGLGQRMHASGGLLYGANGEVYDPVLGSIVGVFGSVQFQGGAPICDVAPGAGAEPVLFAMGEGYLLALDRATRLPTGKYRADASGLRGNARRAVRCGPDVLACAYEGLGGIDPPRVGLVRLDAFVHPETPDGARVERDGGGGLQFAWYDASQTETGFEVQRRRGDGEFATAATLPAGSFAWVDEEAYPVTGYSYRVRAILPAGPTDWSVVAAAPEPLGTLSLLEMRGKARDSARPGRDRFEVIGTLERRAPSGVPTLDPAVHTLDAEFGGREQPFVLSIPAGDPGWRYRRAFGGPAFLWANPRGSRPRIVFILIPERGVFGLFAKYLDFEVPLANPVRCVVRWGTGSTDASAGGEELDWTVKRNGALKLRR